MRFETISVHAGDRPDTRYGAISVPIYQTSTFVFEDVGKTRGFDYSRTANPTRKVLQDTIEILKPVTEKLKEKEQVIGERLSQAMQKARLEERVIGACPICQNGKLVILRSRKTGKRFIGCTNYFEGKCRTAFPLPQRGLVKPLGSSCKSCGWPTVRVWLKGKRPWNLCLNPECPAKTKEERR